MFVSLCNEFMVEIEGENETSGGGGSLKQDAEISSGSGGSPFPSQAL